ncbi:hypothetical protein U14_05557 [Candidatus Moduliflexus flocculans]|uniref:Lipoprotein n=1 Tax=Candidatus Moduliflexus flocculans TaxID=1499966 RepID=A0A081BS97_9BACT|nr:hypothetical protein U14_05557 [Candidatus Moduliflexus flocculans]
MKRRNLLWGAVALIASLSMLAGCSDSDNPISALLSDISVSVNALNFTAAVNASQFQTVTIKNLATENVTVERVTSTNDAFKVGGYVTDQTLIPLELPVTIEPSGARVVYIGFYPTEAKTYVGKLVVEGTDTQGSPETDIVELTGVGRSTSN